MSAYAAALAALSQPTPAEAATALRLYTDLYATVQSQAGILLEGVPAEWPDALDQIQRVLTAYKRETQRAITAAPHQRQDRLAEEAAARAVWSARASAEPGDTRQLVLLATGDERHGR